jgi:hypothetical protein
MDSGWPPSRALDYWLMQARLWVAMCVCDPEP